MQEFFSRQKSFYLTGGAALAGYHLGHRTTEDLDLFTQSAPLDEGDNTLRETARKIGAEIEALQTSPDFRRRLVSRGDEAVVVDLVWERAPRGEQGPQLHGVVAVDPPGEILANKLCTLLSRAELRDLVDVMALEGSGYDLPSALILAAKKDAGMTPAQLAWILSQIRIGDDAEIPGNCTVSELRSFVELLQQRLTRMAFPGAHESS
ncbi:MAG: nucleotidyl transferase AbiEii/AbiGii toxin family protein [Acidobacteriota bacterium]